MQQVESAKIRVSSLSISSNSSKLSVSSSRDFSPHASPRRGLLATYSPPLSPTSTGHDDYKDRDKSERYCRAPCMSGRAAFSLFLIISGTFLLLNSFINDLRHATEAVSSDFVDRGHLPTSPSAIVVNDNQGSKKWTVWIPPTSQFPLRPWEYAEICTQAEQIQLELHGGTSMLGKKKTYYHNDKKFMDVSMAIKSGSLPHPDTVKGDSPIQVLESPSAHTKECEKSMTFVMETEDVGMGNSLLALWLTYGLAIKEGRDFFIDDTRWPYGKYTDYFKAPPIANCRPPSTNERVPCPRSAQHLVISAATFSFVYGHSFATEYVDKSKPASLQHHRINHLMRKGYKDLFHLADAGDAAYVVNRTRGDLYNSVKHSGGMTIGVHVRRGDVHPWEQEFNGDYLPLTRYMNEVREILITAYEHDDEPPRKSSAGVKPKSRIHRKLKASTTSEEPKNKVRTSGLLVNIADVQVDKRHAPAGFAASQVFMASDDPLIYGAPEMSRLVRAQDRIVLASKADLDQMTGHQAKGPVDHVHGWEGGFYAAEFLSLGVNEKRIPLPARERLVGYDVQSESSRRLNSALHSARDKREVDKQKKHPLSQGPTPAALQLRRIVGRAYLLDLAVIGQSDAIVCGVSSAACRVLGVMAGWKKIKANGWRNVDGKFGWQGLVVQ